MCFAKGIASGFPTGGIAIEGRHLERMPTGVLGGTYGGGSMAHAAMHATIGVIEGDRLVANAAQRGEQLMRGLKGMCARHVWPIKDIRGRGLMAAIEFDADAATAPKVRPKLAVRFDQCGCAAHQHTYSGEDTLLDTAICAA